MSYHCHHCSQTGHLRRREGYHERRTFWLGPRLQVHCQPKHMMACSSPCSLLAEARLSHGWALPVAGRMARARLGSGERGGSCKNRCNGELRNTGCHCLDRYGKFWEMVKVVNAEVFGIAKFWCSNWWEKRMVSRVYINLSKESWLNISTIL